MSEKTTHDAAQPITNEEKLNILLQFADRDNNAIKELLVRMIYNNITIQRVTDESGKIIEYGLSKNLPIKIEVKRKDGTYKSIATLNTGQSSREIKIISPTRKFEAATKIAKGIPGSMTTQRPVQHANTTAEGRNDVGSPVLAITRNSNEKSGKQWVNRFMPSKETMHLKSPFRENVEAFIAAMQSSGAQVTINTTLRPPQRSYLMYFAREIAKGRISPDKVPEFIPKNGDNPVEIDWAHRDQLGKPNIASAINAAKQMDATYGAAGIIGKPYKSNHNIGKAIDMKISPNWAIGNLIKNKQGTTIQIKSKRDLIDLGASYKVFHWTYSGPRAKDDEPHWSETGN